jgi:WXG100 family type VII secretion target
MAGEIRAEYNQLSQIANRFMNQSNSVQQTLNQIRSRMEVLEGGSWIGRGFDSFSREMNGEVIPAVNRLIQALEEGNRATNQIANIMHQAEDEASARFRIS